MNASLSQVCKKLLISSKEHTSLNRQSTKLLNDMLTECMAK